MKYLGPNFIISRIRSDDRVELVERSTGRLLIQSKAEGASTPVIDQNLLSIPGVTPFTERFIQDLQWLSNLRQRRLEYVRTKITSSRKKKRKSIEYDDSSPNSETNGEGSKIRYIRERLSRKASKRTLASIESTSQSIISSSGRSEDEKKLATQLAAIFKSL
jgi:hypothetical protein